MSRNLKPDTGLKDLPVDFFDEFALHRVGGIAIGKDRQVGAFGEAAYPLRVVVVLVRQEHRIDGIDRFTDCFEHESDPLAGKAGINQDFAVAGA